MCQISRGSGWRVGRNPPSVRCSICLIGEPAPRAELTGVYIPFHSAARGPFHPDSSPPSGTPGRDRPIIVTRYQHGYRFCAPAQALASHLTWCASAMWVEFPQAEACNCTPTRHPRETTGTLSNSLIRKIHHYSQPATTIYLNTKQLPTSFVA